VPSKAEVSLPTKECPEPFLWHCYDPMTAEVEVLDFIAQLIKTVKPKVVVETGSYCGVGACYIGKALKENMRGKLITCEIVPELHAKTVELVDRAGMKEVVDCRLTSSLDLEINEPIDILFSDSLPEIRVKEIDRFWDRLSTNALIVVHDVNSGAHHALRERILQLDRDGRLSVTMLPTPRGLAICQKRKDRT
jgi:predicted O-methyltransferase YrrM